DIGVAGVAPDTALEEFKPFRVSIDGAAAAVGQGDHTVDVIALEQLRAVEMRGDCARYRGRAVHRRQDADVVARADAPIRAAIPPEAATLFRWQHWRAGNWRRHFVAGMALRHDHVMDMDVLAGSDVPAGDADDLTVFEHWLPRRNSAAGNLVPSW